MGGLLPPREPEGQVALLRGPPATGHQASPVREKLVGAWALLWVEQVSLCGAEVLVWWHLLDTECGTCPSLNHRKASKGHSSGLWNG